MDEHDATHSQQVHLLRRLDRHEALELGLFVAAVSVDS
jgi:hypothetical protein